MPPVSRFRIAAVEELFRQLAYAPSEATRRHMDAAEKLLADIDARQNYPEDFVIYRITGFRPEPSEETATLVGSALVGDLVSLIQRFSLMISLRLDETERKALSLEEVGRRLQVAPKTIQRYRRKGLVCHFVVFSDEDKRLACFEDALERFIQRNREEVEKAGRFTRVGWRDVQRIVSTARQLQEEEDLTLNEAARRLAKKHHRAQETVRLILQRHDRRAEKPIFTPHGPLSARDQRIIDRAWRFGVPAAELARRFQRNRATIQRVINRARGEFLISLNLTHVELPTFVLDDAASIILTNPAVIGGLNSPLPEEDALELIASLRNAPDHDEEIEDALLAGYNLLKRHAETAISKLPDWPSSLLLDQIETDLRWAALLKRRLVDLALPTTVARIDQNLHGPLIAEPAERIISLLAIGIDVCGQVVEGLDPSRGQHLLARTALAADRRLAGLETRGSSRRAAARHGPGAVLMSRPFDELTVWQKRLELRAGHRSCVPELDEQLQEAVILRYGLGGEPPLAYGELAERLKITPTAAARLVERARSELRRRARER